MIRSAMFLSLVLVAPAAAQSQQPAQPVAGAADRTVVLRACVEQGTHGSVANLSQTVVISPGRAVDNPHRFMYWFNKNVEEVRNQIGHLGEISGTIAEVLTGSPELRATDGVFAQARISPAGNLAAVGTTGSAAD